ncbi:hypothetical protein Tco_1476845 [Tanacetum coccineum]
MRSRKGVEWSYLGNSAEYGSASLTGRGNEAGGDFNDDIARGTKKWNFLPLLFKIKRRFKRTGFRVFMAQHREQYRRAAVLCDMERGDIVDAFKEGRKRHVSSEHDCLCTDAGIHLRPTEVKILPVGFLAILDLGGVVFTYTTEIFFGSGENRGVEWERVGVGVGGWIAGIGLAAV